MKEKGFDLPSSQYFIAIDSKIKNNQNNTPYNWNKIHAGYSAPLLFEATTWLREAKGVHVYVQIINEGEGICYYHPNIQDVATGEYFESEIFDGEHTHDLALESGIIRALKHYVK